jgi:AcrR family transcriptional regulator
LNLRSRAILAEEKEERRHAILDAAEQLLLEHAQRVASVDEVAAKAGLAKGTVYLYFASKEQILLALHERSSDRFFTALQLRLAQKKTVSFDDMFAIVRAYMVDVPGFLPLAAMCFGLMEKSVPVELAAEHKLRIAKRLQLVASGLQQHYPQLTHEQGVALLLHSYALIVGLWQMLHPSPVQEALAHYPEQYIFRRDYADELFNGMRALWAGTLNPPPPANPPRRKKSLAKVSASSSRNQT